MTPVSRPGSQVMDRLLAEAERLARGDSPVVLLGETGSGKEWLARRIHEASRRSGHPFVALNCAAVPESLFESELFGHERGAFTGAERQRRGHFELAHRGTLFLDEVGETPLHLQAKLLRAVEQGAVQRLGGEAPVEIDVRILAATNRDLEQEMAEGRFRKDLYYRLAVSTLTLPPLRQRRSEIPALAREILARARHRSRRIEGFAPEALEVLAAYDWPGNVRELSGVVERAAQLAEGPRILVPDLPLRVVVAGRSAGRVLATVLHWPEERWLDRTLPEVREEMLATVEREYLRAQLRHTGGDLAETARRAGVSSRTLYNKMAELGLDKGDFRPSRSAGSGASSAADEGQAGEGGSRGSGGARSSG